MTILAATPIPSAPRPTPSEPAAPPRAQAATAGADFSAALAKAGETSAPVPGKGAQSGAMSDLQQFEGFVLRTFVESMLPAKNSSFFGSGTAGDIWRSMMAERLGDEIAASGGIGIADLLAGTGGASQVRDRLAAESDAVRAGSAATTRMR